MNRRNTLIYFVYLTLITACSGTLGDAESANTKPKPKPKLMELPADTAVSLSSFDNGVRRLEAKDLGAALESQSTYRRALAREDFGDAARSFVASYPKVFGHGPIAPEFSLRASQTDALGITVVRLDQHHSGLPVFDSELVFYFSGESLNRVIGDYLAAISLPSITPKNPETAAFSVAAAALDGLSDCSSCSAELGVYSPRLSNQRTEPRLTWAIDAGVSPLNSWRLFIDAESLAVLDRQRQALSARR